MDSVRSIVYSVTPANDVLLGEAEFISQVCLGA
jgi:hypothetical protein